MAGLAIFLVFAFVKMFFCVYFWFISKNWFGMAYIALVTCIISLVMTIFVIPESPRYLYGRKKFEETRTALKVF
jgi:membrane protein YdbS with pleckstrin-like domain